MALLRIEGLQKSYGGRRVVDGVSLKVDSGEIVGLLGPNGAGKTTTFRMIVGLERPERGELGFAGHDITRLPVHRRARLGLGYLAQQPSTFRELSVLDNLLLVLEFDPRLDRAAREARADELLERLRLGPLASQKAGQLSGGEERRLEIARVLSLGPSLLLLDEPFANIDPRTVEELQDILRVLAKDGLSVLLTDHNVHDTLSLVDRAAIIVDGRILKEGAADALVEDEEVRRNYLGTRFQLVERERLHEADAPEADADAEADAEAEAEPDAALAPPSSPPADELRAPEIQHPRSPFEPRGPSDAG